jgi:hypothetical protein
MTDAAPKDDLTHYMEATARYRKVVALVPSAGKLRWLAAVLDIMDERNLWPATMPWDFGPGVGVRDLHVDGSGDAVQRDLRALADALQEAGL